VQQQIAQQQSDFHAESGLRAWQHQALSGTLRSLLQAGKNSQ
jgi:hypothetical protein